MIDITFYKPGEPANFYVMQLKIWREMTLSVNLSPEVIKKMIEDAIACAGFPFVESSNTKG
jgi:hypothetical protein